MSEPTTRALDVIERRATWSVEQADCLAWLNALPADALDLVVCSPPYDAARTYGIGFTLKGEAWAEWMCQVVRAALRVCRGPVVVVCQGQTIDYAWTGSPFLLAANLLRAGVTLRRPVIYRRSGIPGSGGADYFRCDHEYCLVATRGGRLPWADPLACGHPPKYGPGGAMSNRTKGGERVNQWGNSGKRIVRLPDGMLVPQSSPSEQDPWQKRGRGNNLGGRHADGSVKQGTKKRGKKKPPTDDNTFAPPAIANPGDVIDCGCAGGGHMGSRLAHENEAPFPEQVPERYILSFCPPDGLVADLFIGSGTTGAVARRHGRRFIGCDVRASQVKLARRRISAETPPLFPAGPSCPASPVEKENVRDGDEGNAEGIDGE